ncbi:hypothetical protein ACMGE7_01845 [Macrococcus equi]|uniref:hypothetical protein n=1 Tax=Macrococcus equi TaxID=3395462 RepID=UPI0039BE6E7D
MNFKKFITKKNRYKIKDKFLEQLKSYIENQLPKNESVLSVQLARSTNSIYLTLINHEMHQILQFRVSDHKASAKTKAIKTIYLGDHPSVKTIGDEILHFKSLLTWMNIDYKMYFLLYVIYYVKPKNMRINVRMGRSPSGHAPIGFEVQKFNDKLLIDTYKIIGRTEVYIKRMLTQGLLDYETSEHKFIHVTAGGLSLIHEYLDIYHERLKKDIRDLKWSNLKLPEDKIIEKAYENIFIDHKQICPGKYYIYALKNMMTNQIEYINYTKEDLIISELINKKNRNEYYQLCKNNLQLAISKNEKIEPLIIMTHLTKKEAEVALMSIINMSKLSGPSNFVTINHLAQFKKRQKPTYEILKHSFSADGDKVKRLSNMWHVDIKDIKDYNILIVKVDLGGEDIIARNILKKRYSTHVKAQALMKIEIGEKRVSTIDYIIGVCDKTGEVVCSYYVISEPMKEDNITGTTKYQYNFTESVVPAKFPIRSLMTNRIKLTHYAFVDEAGQMKKSKRRMVYYAGQ